MIKSFLDIVGSQGVFAVFFYFLLSYMLKEQSRRDAAYQESLKQFISILSAMKEELDTMKIKILKN